MVSPSLVVSNIILHHFVIQVDGARSKSNLSCFTLSDVESILEEENEKVIVAYLVNFTFIFVNHNVVGCFVNEKFLL